MKNLITKDIVSEVNAMNNSDDACFSEFEIPEHFKIRLGNVVVRRMGDTSSLEIDDCVNKDLFAHWRKDVGHLLSYDLKHRKYDGYYELRANGKKALLRKIEYKDLVDLKEHGYNHVYIGDFWYTILRVVPVSGNYADADAAAETDTGFYDYSCISEFDVKDTNVRVYDEDSESIALFDDPLRIASDVDVEPAENPEDCFESIDIPEEEI